MAEAPADLPSTAHVDLSFFKVLAVIDPTSEPTSQNSVITYFQASAMPAKVVFSEAEAQQALDSERFDLVFIEFSQGSVQGPRVLQAIRRSQSHYATVPVLAYVDDTFDAEGLSGETGVQDVLKKPTDEKTFLVKMQEWANKIFEALPVLQESSIDKIRIFDDEEQTLLTSLFQIYTESTGSELVEIEKLVEGDDFDLLRKKAHKLKSSAAQLGAFRFEKYCNLMEHDPSLNQERAQKLYKEMSMEYQKSLAEFDRYRQKYAAT